MKLIPCIIAKLVFKGVALILLSVLTIFNCIFKIVIVVFNIASIPLAVIGTIMFAFDCFTGSFTMDTVYIALVSIVLVALRYLLPLLMPVLDKSAFSLKNYVSAPLRMKVKSPVRYTM